MNIGITVYPTYGGSGIVGSELGKELAARGHTIHFISSSLPTRLTELGDRVRFHEVEMMSFVETKLNGVFGSIFDLAATQRGGRV